MFEKGKQPSPARQRQLDRYARLVASGSLTATLGWWTACRPNRKWGRG